MAAETGFDARTVDRLRGWLFAVVCSWRWEQDVIGRFEAGDVKIAATGARTVRMLHSKGVYPPGGPATRMKRCDACRRWTPPQAIGSSGICIDCFYCKIPIEQAAALPSSHRFNVPIRDAEARAYVASGMINPNRKRRAQFVADDPRIVGGRIDDDGVLHDPWLGESPGVLPAAAAAAAAGAGAQAEG